MPLRRTDPSARKLIIEGSVPLEQFLHTVSARLATSQWKNAGVAVSRLAHSLGRPARVSDLTNDTLRACCEAMLAGGLKRATIDRYREALIALARLAFEAGQLAHLPAVGKYRPRWDRRSVRPFCLEELAALFGSARTMPGDICGVPSGAWWPALLLTILDLETPGAKLLLVPLSAFDRRALTLTVGFLRYDLHSKTAAALVGLGDAARDRLFPWHLDNARPPFYMLYHRYQELLARARLTIMGSLFDRLLASAESIRDCVGKTDLTAPFVPDDFPLRQPRAKKPIGNQRAQAAYPIGFGKSHAKGRKRPTRPEIVSIKNRLRPTLREFFETVYKPRRLLPRETGTHISYRAAINRLCDMAGCEVTLEQLSDDLVERLIVWMQQGGWAAATRKRTRGELLAIWRYAWKKKWTETLPRDVEEVRVPLRVPEAWSTEEMGRLLAAAATCDGHVMGIRAALYWPALILLIYDTGLRINTVMQLQTADLDLDRGWIKARWNTQKQKNDQALPLSADSIRLLLATGVQDRPLVFPWPFKHRGQSLCARLRKLLQLAGLRDTHKDLWHKIRRTNGTYVADAGGEEAAMRQLGHSALSVTRRYIDPTKLSAPRLVDSMQRPTWQPPKLLEGPQ